jgi:cytochrome bd ubiquinol oxidase subunit II
MDLAVFWFVLIGVLWVGFLALEGFDFGIGMLVPVLGKEGGLHGSPEVTAGEAEKRRRVLLTTIGPHWDGNEVWLLTAGGATFAAFPHWYATMFSAFYLPLLLVLVALIVRNMGFEYRHKRDDATWRRNWDWAIVGGSIASPLLVGVALTNVVRGLPLELPAGAPPGASEFTGSVFSLLNPMALLGGLVIVGLSLTHGAFFAALKTSGTIRDEAREVGTRAGVVTAFLAVALLGWLGVADGTPVSWATTVVAAVALVAGLVFNLQGAEGKAFASTMVTIAMAVTTYFVILFPDVMPSTLNPAWSLTIENASSSELTLKIMTGAALVFTPIVLGYTAWMYWVFRRRISTDQIPDPVSVR